MFLRQRVLISYDLSVNTWSGESDFVGIVTGEEFADPIRPQMLPCKFGRIAEEAFWLLHRACMIACPSWYIKYTQLENHSRGVAFSPLGRLDRIP